MFNSEINEHFRLNWQIWTEMPAATVLMMQDREWSEDLSQLSKHLQINFERLISEDKISINRIFLIFKCSNFKVAQKLLDFYKTEISSYHLTVEVCDFIERLRDYDYVGLEEFFLNSNESRFAILTLTPSRATQAMRLGVYHTEEDI